RSLIEIGDSKSALKYLNDRSNYLNQLTALRVLENINGSSLTPEMVIPFLKSGNTILESAARRIISRNIEWKNEVLNIFNELIKKSQLSDDENQLVESIILEYSDDSNFEIQLTNLINGEQSTNTTTLNSLKAMEIMDKFSPPIRSTIESKLFSDSLKVRNQTISLLVKFPPSDKACEKLLEIANNKENASQIRVMALEAITKKTKSLSHEDLRFLIEISKSKSNPSLGIQSARAIGNISLKVNETDQISNIYKTLETASPIQINHLLKPFRSLNSEEINQIEKSNKNIQTLLNPSIDDDTDRKKTLESIESTMGIGNVSRGRAVFFSNKSTCALCHSINGNGGNLGPDLSKLGAIRNKKDFLEAILFPNSTIVNGSENYIITTLSGQTYTGIIQRENSEFIYLANLNNTRQAIHRDKIKEMKRSPISLMPTGLNKTLNNQELSDLIAFLQSCK
ncbi:MAG: c-type cytochrome, partial [Verrucomicrobiales bacterium]